MPVIVYDTKLRRPGCALLQAAFGGDEGMAGRFPTEHWLLGPTEDMKPYRVSVDELKQIIEYHWKLAGAASRDRKANP